MKMWLLHYRDMNNIQHFHLYSYITFNPTAPKLCTIYLDNNIQHQQETKQEHNPALQ